MKLKERATVTDNFKSVLKYISYEKLRNIKRDLVRAGDNRKRNHILALNRKAIAFHREIAEGISGVGRGLDAEVARLRQTPYRLFDTYVWQGQGWLFGETRDLVIKPVGGYDVTYTSTPYRVFVHIKDMLSGTPNVHFIPIGFEDTDFRHRHQCAYQPHDFLSSKLWTCWGNFNAPISDFVLDGNVSALFSILHVFVSQYTKGHNIGNMANNNRWASYRQGGPSWTPVEE